MKKNIWILFIVIAFIRVVFFNFQSFHIDMNAWEAWAYRLVNFGFSNFYSKDFYSEYFPGYLYLLRIIGDIYRITFNSLSFSSFQFEVFVKSLSTIFDLGTSYLIYRTVLSIKPKFAAPAALIYFANPAVIFNSSVWGQIDGIYTFFLFLSTYLLISGANKYLSVFLSSVSFIIKPQAIFLVPVLFIKLYKEVKLKTLFLSAALFLVAVVVLAFPFFPSNPVGGFLAMVQRSAELYPYTSLNAFNFWSLFGSWKTDTQKFIIPLEMWGIILYFLSLVVISIPLLLNKKKGEISEIFFISVTLSFFSSFLFLTRMHERYLFPVLAFYLVYAIQNRKFLILYFLISIVHSLNLWYVYYFYNFIFNNLDTKPNVLYVLIDKFHYVLSAFLITGFFSIVVFYYVSFSKKNS